MAKASVMPTASRASQVSGSTPSSRNVVRASRLFLALVHSRRAAASAARPADGARAHQRCASGVTSVAVTLPPHDATTAGRTASRRTEPRRPRLPRGRRRPARRPGLRRALRLRPARRRRRARPARSATRPSWPGWRSPSSGTSCGCATGSPSSGVDPDAAMRPVRRAHRRVPRVDRAGRLARGADEGVRRRRRRRRLLPRGRAVPRRRRPSPRARRCSRTPGTRAFVVTTVREAIAADPRVGRPARAVGPPADGRDAVAGPADGRRARRAVEPARRRDRRPARCPGFDLAEIGRMFARLTEEHTAPHARPSACPPDQGGRLSAAQGSERAEADPALGRARRSRRRRACRRGR